MANRFNVEQIGKKVRVNRNLAQETPSSPYFSLARNSFRQLLKTYDFKLWLSFYFALLSSALITAVIIEKTGIASRIMDRVRTDQRSSFMKPNLGPDFSSLSITSDPGLVALITYPNGSRVGEDVDYIRFLEVEGVTMTTTTPASDSGQLWSIYSKRIESGIYIIDLNTQRQGEFQFTLNAYHRNGIEQSRFTQVLKSNNIQTFRYILFFDKYSSKNTSFVFQDTLNAD
jgi:hypothetical protein